MKIEKFGDWWLETGIHEVDGEHSAWLHQQSKIDDILDYISLIGHQKELDHFLSKEKGWDNE